MAEGLDPVLETFIANTRPYVSALNDAIGAAREFARANLEAAAAIKTMQAAASGDARDLADIASSAADAASAEADLRTTAAEAALALALQGVAASSAADATAGLAAAEAAAGAAASGGFLASITGSIGPIAIAAGVVAGLGLGVQGLIPDLVAAGLGLGAFGALALPTFTAVTGAVSTLSTDTAAYKAAVGDLAKDQALAKIRADWAALDPAQRQAVRSVQDLQSAWSKMAQQFEPVVMPIFNQLLDIAKTLMPLLVPLANAAAGAIGQLLGQFDKFVKSQGFQDFIFQMSKLAGPAIETIGTGLGRIAIAAGRLLMAMANPDALRILKGLLDGIAYTLTGLAIVFTTVTRAAISFYHEVAVVFDGARHEAAALAADFVHWFDVARHALASFANFNLTAWADRMLTDLGKFTVQGITDIGKFTVAAVTGLGKFTVFGITEVGRFTVTVLTDIGRFVVQGVAALGRFVAGAVQVLATLPGRILAIVANFGSLLVNAGRALIQGLINGITSMFGSLAGVVGSIAGMIAKIKGPLDYDRQLLVPHGQAIMAGLMAGIGSQLPALARQMGTVTGMVSGVPAGGLAYAGAGAAGGGRGAVVAGGPVVNVTVNVAGSVLSDQQLITKIQAGMLDMFTRTGALNLTPAWRRR